MLFDDGFLQNLLTELKKMNKGKAGTNYRYPNSLILLPACHRTCVPTSIPKITRLSKGDVSAYKETPRDNTRLHNNLVEENNKDNDKPQSKSKPRKRRYRDSNS